MPTFSRGRSVAGAVRLAIAGAVLASVIVAPVDPAAAHAAVPAIQVEFTGGARIRIPASIPPALAAAVVTALATR